MTSTTATIARHLRTLRAEQDPRLRLEDVAEATGIRVATLSAYENGHNAPSADKLALLARFYEVSADYILGLSPSRNGLPSGRWVVDEDFLDLLVRGEKLHPDDLEPFRARYDVRKGDPVWACELPIRARIVTAAEVRRLAGELRGLRKLVPGPLKRIGRRHP